MIFKQWEQVVGLELPIKAQTRRPVKHREYGLDERGFPIGLGNVVHSVFFPDGRLKWQVGHTYAIQPGRGKKAVGRIRITKIRRERLGDISSQDTFAEGIDTGEFCTHLTQLGGFQRLWNSIYGKDAWGRMKDDDVWVLEWPPVEKNQDQH